MMARRSGRPPALRRRPVLSGFFCLVCNELEDSFNDKDSLSQDNASVAPVSLLRGDTVLVSMPSFGPSLPQVPNDVFILNI